MVIYFGCYRPLPGSVMDAAGHIDGEQILNVCHVPQGGEPYMTLRTTPELLALEQLWGALSSWQEAYGPFQASFNPKWTRLPDLPRTLRLRFVNKQWICGWVPV